MGRGGVTSRKYPVGSLETSVNKGSCLVWGWGNRYQVTGSTQWEVYSGLDHEHFTPRCEESGPAIHLYFRVSISHLGARKVAQQLVISQGVP